MKAMLVYVSLGTRVVVPDDANDHQILKVAKPRLLSNLANDYEDHLEGIYEDVESPYDPKYDNK